MNWRLIVAAQLVVGALLFPLAPAWADIFNPRLILSDDQLRDASAMNYDEVRDFLRAKGGLAGFSDVDAIDGKKKDAARLITDAADRYRVNPRYILALIQKESSIVETAIPTKEQLDWAAGYSLCDGCSKRSSSALRNKGFARQVDAGAGFVKWYFENVSAGKGLKLPGTAYNISDTSVTPGNLATAALYSYTPHLHGNHLLWSIWNRFFAGDSFRLQYPDGSLVRNEKNGAVALIQNGRFRPILSRAVLTSRFNENTVINLNEYDFAELQEQHGGGPVRFSDYTLVRTETGATYLLAGLKRRKISSPEVFSKIGFNPEEVEVVSSAELADYAEGVPITMASAAPEARLAQDTATGGVYYVEGEVKRPIWDRAILLADFPGKPIVPTSPTQLAALTTGDPVTFIEGTLVRENGKPAVYVISGNKKRLIPTADIFNGLGYRWNAILVTSTKAMGLMETGVPLFLAADHP